MNQSQRLDSDDDGEGGGVDLIRSASKRLHKEEGNLEACNKTCRSNISIC